MIYTTTLTPQRGPISPSATPFHRAATMGGYMHTAQYRRTPHSAASCVRPYMKHVVEALARTRSGARTCGMARRSHVAFWHLRSRGRVSSRHPARGGPSRAAAVEVVVTLQLYTRAARGRPAVTHTRGLRHQKQKRVWRRHCVTWAARQQLKMHTEHERRGSPHYLKTAAGVASTVVCPKHARSKACAHVIGRSLLARARRACACQGFRCWPIVVLPATPHDRAHHSKAGRSRRLSLGKRCPALGRRWRDAGPMGGARLAGSRAPRAP